MISQITVSIRVVEYLMVYMCFTINVTVKIDAYPNTSEVEQGTTVVLVCREVGVPYGSELAYNWTCARGRTCDNPSKQSQPGSRRQYNNTVVVDIVNERDNGDYQCNVSNRRDGVILGSDTHRISVTGLFTSLYDCHLILLKLIIKFKLDFNIQALPNILYGYCLELCQLN